MPRNRAVRPKQTPLKAASSRYALGGELESLQNPSPTLSVFWSWTTKGSTNAAKAKNAWFASKAAGRRQTNRILSGKQTPDRCMVRHAGAAFYVPTRKRVQGVEGRRARRASVSGPRRLIGPDRHQPVVKFRYWAQNCL